jgi:hypothetical protein
VQLVAQDRVSGNPRIQFCENRVTIGNPGRYCRATPENTQSKALVSAASGQFLSSFGTFVILTFLGYEYSYCSQAQVGTASVPQDQIPADNGGFVIK